MCWLTAPTVTRSSSAALARLPKSSRHFESAQGGQRVAIEPVHGVKLNQFAAILIPNAPRAAHNLSQISREAKTIETLLSFAAGWLP